MALIAPLALFGLLIAALLIGLFREDQDALPSVFIDQPTPPLAVTPLGGHPPFQPDQLKTPGLKLVNFWASWCPPCRAEHPQFMALAKDGWSIIGINKSDTEPNALAFLGELGNPYMSIGADPSGRAAIEWGVYGLPETFLIDGKGHIRLRHPGPVTRRIWNDRFVPIIRALEAAQD